MAQSPSPLRQDKLKNTLTVYLMYSELSFRAFRVLYLSKLVVSKVTDSNGISERFCNGSTDAWRALGCTQQKHGDTQSGTYLLIDATATPVSTYCVRVCFDSHSLFLSHTSFPKHLTPNARDTYWHIIRSEQCVLLWLISASASLCCAAKYGATAAAFLIA